MTETATKDRVQIIYDTQCPACDFYCNLIQLRDEGVALDLIDARDNPDCMMEITQRGWDIDQGMVVIVGDAWYYASDAIHILATVSGKQTFFNRFARWLFKSPGRAKFFYPILRSCRNLLLKLLRRSKINNLDMSDNERF